MLGLSSARALVATLALATLAACGSSGSVEEPDDDDVTVENVPPATPVPAAPVETPAPAKPPRLGPIGEWTWLDVPGAECGMGQPTGFGVNEGPGDDVLIYLEGGGLCWDEFSCNIDIPNFVPLASYFMGGYTVENFRRANPRSGIFDRSRADNPFKNATIVYVPYCTGDFHSGRTTQLFPSSKKTAHYAGRKNLDLDLAKVLTAHPSPSRVTLAGTSAGGFGALINFGHVHDLFGSTRVDLISDSAPALWMRAPIFAGLGSWDFGPSLPAGCTDCGRDLRGLYAYYAKTYPDSRLAVTTFDADFPMALGGYALLAPSEFTGAIDKLAKATLEPLSNFRAFVPSGQTHGMLYDLDVAARPKRCNNRVLGVCLDASATGDAVTLGQWLTRMTSDDPSWGTLSSIPQ